MRKLLAHQQRHSRHSRHSRSRSERRELQLPLWSSDAGRRGSARPGRPVHLLGGAAAGPSRVATPLSAGGLADARLVDSSQAQHGKGVLGEVEGVHHDRVDLAGPRRGGGAPVFHQLLAEQDGSDSIRKRNLVPVIESTQGCVNLVHLRVGYVSLLAH